MENDYDVDNYTSEELYELLKLDTSIPITTQRITVYADAIIKNYNENHRHDLKDFFINIKKRLIDEIQESENQETLIVNEDRDIERTTGYDIPVKRIKVNPTIHNIIQRRVNIDSVYRETSFPLKDDSIRYISTMSDCSCYNCSDYTCNLTDKLDNLLSITLHSVQIPFSWYCINKHNNVFKINEDLVIIEPGNYSSQELVDEISNNTVFISNNGVCSYSKQTEKINISLSSESDKIVFYDSSNSFENSKSNNNLGWILGYRNSIYSSENAVIEESLYVYKAEALINTHGPKYLMLMIDEYKGNSVNKGITSIETSENKLSLPSYFSNDMTYSVENVDNGEVPQYSNIRNINRENLPKNITNAQITTINEIIKSRKDSVETKLKSPSDSNVFAIIPFRKTNPFIVGELIDTIGDIEANKRVYLGPVDVDRLRLRLTDDKGNLLDLNGLDWSISLMTEHLYES
tara:strand:+ start:398 stop:1783 length:1386 start_codon:yes stop_codon:yes gene_type:complete